MLDITYWLMQAEVWLIFALVLIIADILIGLGLFVLPIGIAGAFVSLILFAEGQYWFTETPFLESWKEVLIAFGALSLVSVYIVRKLFQRENDQAPDINEY